MAATICPTVLAATPDDYRTQMQRVAPFAVRVHIDLADGRFAPTTTIAIGDAWWPGGVRADLHVMYQRPFDHVKTFLVLAPQMVVVHAEADGNFAEFAQLMHRHGIEVGVALKPETPAELIRPALPLIDHVQIFSGDIGHFGGQANMQLLEKARILRQWRPQLEIGWDGGINAQNAAALAHGGIDVLNVGGYIQRAADPAAAYRQLWQLVASR